MNKEDFIDSLIKSVGQNERLGCSTRVGMCREWSGKMLDLIEEWAGENGVDLQVEAREVSLGIGWEHTFVRITVDGWSPVVWDGVGTTKHCQFIGFEDEAPEHLRNSKEDRMINLQHELKKNVKLGRIYGEVV